MTCITTTPKLRLNTLNLWPCREDEFNWTKQLRMLAKDAMELAYSKQSTVTVHHSVTAASFVVSVTLLTTSKYFVKNVGLLLKTSFEST